MIEFELVVWLGRLFVEWSISEYGPWLIGFAIALSVAHFVARAYRSKKF